MATTDDDSIDDFASPQDVLAAQANATQQALQSPNSTTRSTALINANSADNRAQVGRAQQIQTRMQDILAQANAGADPNEDPIQRNLRVASAVSTGMVDLSPQMAMKANDQVLKLKQAQIQQTALQTQEAIRQAQLREQTTKANEAQATSQIVMVRHGGKDADGLPQGLVQVGDPLDVNDPDYAAKAKAAQVAAQQQGYQVDPMLISDFNKSKENLEVTKGQMRFQQIAAKNAAQEDLTAGGLNETIGDYMFHGMSALARLPADQRNQIRNQAAALGLSPMDGVLAQTEIKAMNAAATAAGRRKGNIGVLNESIPALGQNVLDTLDNVQRTRFPMLNSGIVAGKNFAGDPNEGKYAAAIQSFVQDYARVVAGATGVTSDQARKDAHALIQQADNPDKVRQVVQFLSTKEKDAIGQAPDAALELIARPQSYPHASKIMNALGFTQLPGVDPNALGVSGDTSAGPVARPGQSTSGNSKLTYDPKTGTFH